jgi:hypothetical protein
MKFARLVFAGAGIWGMCALVPLFFLVDISGHQYPPPTTYPQFFYGFLAVAFAWQVAFLIIARDPLRFRPLMLPAILEKCGFVVTTGTLWSQGRVSAADASAAVPDAVLAILFLMAFARTRTSDRRRN